MLYPTKKDLWFLPLGGTGEIGMNLNLYGHDGHWLMIDCGVTFDDELSDQGPRADRLCADPCFIVEQRKYLSAIIITHAHEDHIGALPDLWERFPVPVYTTPFTAEILRRKLARANKRPANSIFEISESSAIQVGPFSLTWLRTTHSIPEPCSILIETSVGRILHTGDWKIDAQPVVGKGFDSALFRQLAEDNLDAMVCDSTNATKAGFSASEGDCYRGLLHEVAQASGRVVVTCFASNIGRLITLARVAKKTGRYLAVLGLSMENMVSAAMACGLWPDELRVCNPAHIAYLPREEVLVVTTGSQGEPRSALARLSRGQHRLLELEAGDSVIFSSIVIPGNEADVEALVARFREQKIEVVQAHENERTLHASGHPNQEELRQMYGFVRPRVSVPVHGEAEHINAHAALAREAGVPSQIRGENGDLYLFAPHTGIRRKAVPAGRIALPD